MKICLYNINFLPFDDSPVSLSPLFSPSHRMLYSVHSHKFILSHYNTNLYLLACITCARSFLWNFFTRSIALSHFLADSHLCALLSHTAPIITLTIVCSLFALHSHFVWKSFSNSLFFSHLVALFLCQIRSIFSPFFLCLGEHAGFCFVVCHLARNHTKLAISISKNDSNENYKRKSQL